MQQYSQVFAQTRLLPVLDQWRPIPRSFLTTAGSTTASGCPHLAPTVWLRQNCVCLCVCFGGGLIFKLFKKDLLTNFLFRIHKVYNVSKISTLASKTWIEQKADFDIMIRSNGSLRARQEKYKVLENKLTDKKMLDRSSTKSYVERNQRKIG